MMLHFVASKIFLVNKPVPQPISRTEVLLVIFPVSISSCALLFARFTPEGLSQFHIFSASLLIFKPCSFSFLILFITNKLFRKYMLVPYHLFVVPVLFFEDIFLQ